MLVLNLRSPSPERAARLADYILRTGAEVLVLPETTPSLGMQRLERLLHEHGFVTSGQPPIGRERGVIVAARVSMEVVAGALKSSSTLPARVEHVRVGTIQPLSIVALYVPSRDRSPQKTERKRAFLAGIRQGLERAELLPDLITGDLNILDRSHIPRYPIFQDFEYEFLERLAELGYVDLHHRFLPSQPGYTWIGRTGDGYRYDYIFVRSELVPKTLSFEVLSEPRSSGLTDHCGLMATFDLEAPYNPGRGFRVGPQVSFASRLTDGQEALFQ